MSFRIFLANLLLKLAALLPKASWLMTIISYRIRGGVVGRSFLTRIKREQPWYRTDGDNTYLLNYDLDADSTVFDVGGYIGNSAAAIYCKFGSYVHIFEPVNEYVTRLQKRFGSNEKITIHNYGIGGKTEDITIYISEGSSSLFSAHLEFSDTRDIKIFSLLDAMNKINVDKVDLLSMNIEGAEYELLEKMIDSNLACKFRYIQIQFHDLDQDSSNRRDRVRNRLSLSHHEVFCFPFVWEAWERIEE